MNTVGAFSRGREEKEDQVLTLQNIYIFFVGKEKNKIMKRNAMKKKGAGDMEGLENRSS